MFCCCYSSWLSHRGGTAYAAFPFDSDSLVSKRFPTHTGRHPVQRVFCVGVGVLSILSAYISASTPSHLPGRSSIQGPPTGPALSSRPPLLSDCFPLRDPGPEDFVSFRGLASPRLACPRTQSVGQSVQLIEARSLATRRELLPALLVRPTQTHGHAQQQQQQQRPIDTRASLSSCLDSTIYPYIIILLHSTQLGRAPSPSPAWSLSSCQPCPGRL